MSGGGGGGGELPSVSVYITTFYPFARSPLYCHALCDVSVRVYCSLLQCMHHRLPQLTTPDVVHKDLKDIGVDGTRKENRVEAIAGMEGCGYSSSECGVCFRSFRRGAGVHEACVRAVWGSPVLAMRVGQSSACSESSVGQPSVGQPSACSESSVGQPSACSESMQCGEAQCLQ